MRFEDRTTLEDQGSDELSEENRMKGCRAGRMATNKWLSEGTWFTTKEKEIEPGQLVALFYAMP